MEKLKWKKLRKIWKRSESGPKLYPWYYYWRFFFPSGFTFPIWVHFFPSGFIFPLWVHFFPSGFIFPMWADFPIWPPLPCGRSPKWALSHVGALPCGRSPMWVLSHVGALPCGCSPNWALSQVGALPCGRSPIWAFPSGSDFPNWDLLVLLQGNFHGPSYFNEMMHK